MPSDPPIMDLADHAEGIGNAASVMRANAVASGLDAAVPTCPGWTVRDLVTHQGVVLTWAKDIVSRREPAPDHETEAQAAASVDLLDWLDDALVDLLNALATAPDDLDVFFFLKDAPPPRRAWARRQCHELTVHAVDAMAARLGRAPSAAQVWFGPGLAADGLDELLTGFVPRRSQQLRAATPYTVAVRPTDVDRAWLLRIGPDPVVTTRLTPADATPSEVAQADVTLTGTATQLYLALWNRGDEITVTEHADDAPAGPDASRWLDTWRHQLRITWA